MKTLRTHEGTACLHKAVGEGNLLHQGPQSSALHQRSQREHHETPSHSRPHVTFKARILNYSGPPDPSSYPNKKVSMTPNGAAGEKERVHYQPGNTLSLSH